MVIAARFYTAALADMHPRCMMNINNTAASHPYGNLNHIPLMASELLASLHHGGLPGNGCARLQWLSVGYEENWAGCVLHLSFCSAFLLLASAKARLGQ
jgi:hypothetical protein